MQKTWVFRRFLDKPALWALVLTMALCPGAHSATRLTLSPTAAQPAKAEVPPAEPVSLASPAVSALPQPKATGVLQTKLQAFRQTRALEKRLNQLLKDDPFVGQGHLAVSVQPRKVVLVGSAYSPLQVAQAKTLLAPYLRELPLKDQSVVLDQLPPETDAKTARKAQAVDLRNEALVRLRLLRAGLLRGTQIHVDSTDGVVILNGVVNSERQRQRAEFFAGTLPGVTQVINRLAER